MSATIVWFRQDLRLADNPALAAAVARGGPVIPVFVWGPQEEGAWPPGAASRYWLHHSLAALAADLAQQRSRLILRRGAALAALEALVRETGADAVHWNRRYEPAAIERDGQVKSALLAAGVHAHSHKAAVLVEPFEAQTRAGRPYRVFTPYWRHCETHPEPAPPLPVPSALPAPPAWPDSDALVDLGLEPRLDWAGGIRAAWGIGERAAAAALARFIEDGIDRYADRRDLPATAGVSRLSPHLHFGEITPRRIWHAAREAQAGRGLLTRSAGAGAWLRQLVWRDFAQHLLFHFPATPDAPLRPEFARFPWRNDGRALARWERGETGYPIVDAGLRELWRTGWMHNRVRMLVGSFLVKDLLQDWRAGARWFWDTLVDADLASNTLGWQWVSGCGADAAPYFRIFNPVTQAERFDPEGNYVRRWLPELARLPARLLHAPWQADAATLAAHGVRLDENYPRPIVDHGAARTAALAAFASVRAAPDDAP